MGLRNLWSSAMLMIFIPRFLTMIQRLITVESAVERPGGVADEGVHGYTNCDTQLNKIFIYIWRWSKNDFLFFFINTFFNWCLTVVVFFSFPGRRSYTYVILLHAPTSKAFSALTQFRAPVIDLWPKTHVKSRQKRNIFIEKEGSWKRITRSSFQF